jgi:exodeoxyribonuclease VII small subunit
MPNGGRSFFMSDTKVQSTSDLAEISFEDALRELEGIVASLERGDVSLDDAIKAFERGTALKAHCQASLEEARMKVEQIRLPAEGGPPTESTSFSADG